LIASWLATGPPVRTWLPPVRVDIGSPPAKFWTTPNTMRLQAASREIGSSTRTTDLTRSAKKLPTGPSFSVRASPRANAAAAAMPTPALTKFWTVSPDICRRCPVAASPEYHCQSVLVTKLTAAFQAPLVGRGGKPSESGRCCWSRPKPKSTRTPTRPNPSTDIV
jgi:hypothetical protein